MKEISELKVNNKKKDNANKIRRKIDKRTWLDPLCAFVITFVIFMGLCLLYGITPFGDGRFLTSDLEAQYAPFILTWNEHLEELSEGSHLASNFSYSDNIGAGKNVFSTLGYYTASPINLLAFGLDSSSIGTFITFLVAIKLSLAACFMTIFMRKKATKKESFFPTVLGILYAFSMYAFVFAFNIMWLDAYALLPLILYFVECFLEKHSPSTSNSDGNDRKDSGVLHAGFIVSLVVLFITQFYIAYMVGVFSFVYLLMRLAENWYAYDMKYSAKRLFGIIGKFILNAVASAMLAAIFLFPVAYDILGNSDSTEINYSGASSNTEQILEINFTDVVGMFYLGDGGEFNTTLGDNVPFIFLSLFVSMCFVIFFLDKAFSKREKIVYITTIGFMIVSFAVKYLDIAWHAFDSPNWFSHRYSFCFLPLFLIVTLKVYEKMLDKAISAGVIWKACGIMFVGLIYVQTFGKMAKYDEIFLYNVVFILVYALLMIGIQKDKWHEQLRNMQMICFVLVGVFILSEASFVNGNLNGGISTLTGPKTEYQTRMDINAYEDLVAIANESTNAPRIETEVQSNYMTDCNNANYINYNSISLFNTSTNKAFHRVLRNLGFWSNYNLFASDYSYAAMPVDSFFGIGAILTTNEYTDANLYAQVELDYSVVEQAFATDSSDEVSGNEATNNSDYESCEDEVDVLQLYINPYALSLGFPASVDALSFDVNSIETTYENPNHFVLQNDWYASLFGGELFERGMYQLYSEEDVGEVSLVNASDIPSYVHVDAARLVVGYANDFSDVVISDGTEFETVVYSNNPNLPIVMEYEFTAKYSGEHYINIASLGMLNQTTVYLGEEEIADFAENSYMSMIVRLGYFEEGETISVTISSDNKTAYRYLAINFACLDNEYFASEMEQVLANAATGVTMTDYEQGYVTFNTNLGEGEMLLTTIPYEAGWTCYVDGVETEITPYQGALIAVDVGSGNHEVVLEFVAPGLVLGFIVSAATLGVLVVAGFVQIILKSRSKSIQNK